MENFIAVYPDKEEYMLYDAEPIPFFMSPSFVKSRKDRYSLVDNPLHPGTSTIRVYNAVSSMGEPTYPVERKVAMESIWGSKTYVADSGGSGGSWQQAADGSTFSVSAITKLAMLGKL